MTIALAIVSDSVLLVAADSQESYGWSDKRAKSKIDIGTLEGQHGGGHIFVAGAGDSGFLAYLQRRIIDRAAKLNNNDYWRDQVEHLVSEEVRDFYESHFTMLAQIPHYANSEPPEIIVGARIGAETGLWTTHASTVRRVSSGYEAVGSGAVHAKNLLQHEMKYFVLDERAATQVASYAVFQAKEHDTACGKETHIVCLREKHLVIEGANLDAIHAAEDVFREYDLLRRQSFGVIATPSRFSVPAHSDERLAQIREELAAISFFSSTPPPGCDL